MAQFLAQSTIIPALVTSRSHGLSKESGKLRIGSFSGLRCSNSSDNMVSLGQDFRSKVAISVSSRRGRGGRCVPKAMIERFSDKAMTVITLAQEEAIGLGYNYVGTEHILLGLIGEGTGIAAKVLKSMRINLRDARVEVEKITGRGSGFVSAEIPFSLPFSPRANRVLEFTCEEVQLVGHNYIESEHLLLGLLREGEGVAACVLESLGADPSNTRTQVIHMVGEGNEVRVVTEGASDMPTLEEYGTNLIKLAEEGKLDLGVGWQDEIEYFIQILGCVTLDKAIELMDEAGSCVRLRHAQLLELEKELRQIIKSKNEAVRSQDFDKAYMIEKLNL
ncbi:hypothetical protein V6N13_047488 [Hibiscus sabdariffa]|uniref:Clp R domain-containing protein n=1 Tax=Hibiscus sabdariffa TaxID=183260 RepID=A0ABR2F4B7_9ROSI